jgi:uncharacterized protein with NRDE domain
MCLIVLAHQTSEHFPLVLAANRDEDYDRPSLAADFWPDAPNVLGGRDGLAGGSWLAVTREGRFAAVTNLRGAAPASRSRGRLVSDFVTSSADPVSYADAISRVAEQYSGFHLLAGDATTIEYVTPGARATLTSGIHALTNAPDGERWPKADLAVEAMESALALRDPETIIDALLRFLGTSRGTGAVESEVFIAGERYGTRASTVLVRTPDRLHFAEQSFGRWGSRLGDASRYSLALPMSGGSSSPGSRV